MNIRVFLLLSVFHPAAHALAAKPVDFNDQVRPILNNKCLKCHGGVKKAGDLSLLFRSEALKAGKSGRPALVPGRPEESEFFARITSHDPDELMPKDGEPLTPTEIQTIKEWITSGAEWADHWSYIAPARREPPPTKEPAATRIDAFLNARLEREGLTSAPAADPATQLRRLSLALTGLPPKPEEVRAFMTNTAPDAYEQQVERLLASPAFGERWAAWWLDLARYADSKGYESDGYRVMWPYRDWLVDAFNRDLPFDRFTIEQLAGDLLPDATEEQIIATAFHRNTMNNDEGGTDDEEFRTAAIIDRANSTMEIWNGQTWGCIQCHGHPYDPFVHKEYFEIYDFFNQTADEDKPDDRPTRPVYDGAARQRVKELEARRLGLLEARTARMKEPAFEAAHQEWLRTSTPMGRWTTPDRVQVEATGGAEYRLEPSGTYAASGANPDTNSIFVTVESTQPVQAFRIDLVPEPSMVDGGVGRSRDGNLVLSRIRVLDGSTNTRPHARFVRISLPGPSRILHFAELEVMSGSSNVARGGKATASSVEYGGKPEYGIDGVTEAQFEKAATFHSATEADPWWEVDLLQETPVDTLRLINRKTLETRFQGAKVELLNASRLPVWSVEVADAAPLEFTWSPARVERPIQAGWASLEQVDFGLDHALRPTRLRERGWAVGPGRSQPQHAIFVLDRPVSPGERVRIQMDWLYDRQYTPYRFRVSVSDELALREVASLDPAARMALLKDPAARTPDDQAKLREAYASRSALSREHVDQIESIDREIAAVKKVSLPVMQERPETQRRKTHIFLGGNFLSHDEQVTAGTPDALHDFPAGAPTNRLGFAYWLVATNNPLTARVIVNRFWEQLFGVGIVETLEDFGTQGEKPAHPALLDDLAVRFQTDMRWSTKALLRELVRSAAFRRSSKMTPELTERDPANRLLARGPRFRLTTEQLRDQALAASGILSAKMYGEAVMPYQPPGVWLTPYNDRDWKTSAGEDAYRRAIYTHWRRSNPYPAALNFDAAARDVCVSRRLRTNTPLQALNLLNDRAFLDCAAALGRVMLARAATRPEDALDEAMMRILARPCRDGEREHLLALYQKARTQFDADAESARRFGDSPEHAAWTLVANAMLNLDEALVKQ